MTVNILGLIPARGGSKAIPRKNVAELAGKPLIAYTCAAALDSQGLTRVILNTDDPEIADVGRACGVDVPFMRPEELAEDDTPILPVIQHALIWLQEQQNFLVDIVVLLQPTSPLRRAEHIDSAIDLLMKSGADTVVSVVAVPHNFNPVSVMHLNLQGNLIPFEAGPTILRRQDKPRVFARNGPAVLAVRRETIECDRLYGNVVLPLEMGRIESLDIDDADDLALAEFWLERLSEK
ncbi:MAG: acylneuraminate cytidylyltransferase family protein [Anaerolineales bacterium]|nr:acylneuraminate cytidylyltransferase family protein [Chloroflexota bacterium]MBL6980213.1 acylneuraminate cytidylyltransferase family protein [Anaerolineales bacterium]